MKGEKMWNNDTAPQGLPPAPMDMGVPQGQSQFTLSDILGILKMIEDMIVGMAYPGAEAGAPARQMGASVPPLETSRPTYGAEAELMSRYGR